MEYEKKNETYTRLSTTLNEPLANDNEIKKNEITTNESILKSINYNLMNFLTQATQETNAPGQSLQYALTDYLSKADPNQHKRYAANIMLRLLQSYKFNLQNLDYGNIYSLLFFIKSFLEDYKASVETQEPTSDKAVGEAGRTRSNSLVKIFSKKIIINKEGKLIPAIVDTVFNNVRPIAEQLKIPLSSSSATLEKIEFIVQILSKILRAIQIVKPDTLDANTIVVMQLCTKIMFYTMKKSEQRKTHEEKLDCVVKIANLLLDQPFATVNKIGALLTEINTGIQLSRKSGKSEYSQDLENLLVEIRDILIQRVIIGTGINKVTYKEKMQLLELVCARGMVSKQSLALIESIETSLENSEEQNESIAPEEIESALSMKKRDYVIYTFSPDEVSNNRKIDFKKYFFEHSEQIVSAINLLLTKAKEQKIKLPADFEKYAYLLNWFVLAYAEENHRSIQTANLVDPGKLSTTVSQSDSELMTKFGKQISSQPLSVEDMQKKYNKLSGATSKGESLSSWDERKRASDRLAKISSAKENLAQVQTIITATASENLKQKKDLIAAPTTGKSFNTALPITAIQGPHLKSEQQMLSAQEQESLKSTKASEFFENILTSKPQLVLSLRSIMGTGFVNYFQKSANYGNITVQVKDDHIGTHLTVSSTDSDNNHSFYCINFDLGANAGTPFKPTLAAVNMFSALYQQVASGMSLAVHCDNHSSKVRELVFIFALYAKIQNNADAIQSTATKLANLEKIEQSETENLANLATTVLKELQVVITPAQCQDAIAIALMMYALQLNRDEHTLNNLHEAYFGDNNQCHNFTKGIVSSVEAEKPKDLVSAARLLSDSWPLAVETLTNDPPRQEEENIGEVGTKQSFN